MGIIGYLDTISVPLSFFLTIGYHVYLCHTFKSKPSLTTFGYDTLKRRLWFQDMIEGDDKKGMLAVQSLRNTLMGTILSATISIIIFLSLAALTNNTYNATKFLSSPFFGAQSGKIFVLKFGSASFFLSVSFLCSSMALGYLIDANFLINASREFSCFHNGHTQMMFERGFALAAVGNRMLCITFPLLLWMLGPVPVALSSGALVWGLYGHDFCSQLPLKY